MPKVNNVTRPASPADLMVGDIVEFGSCTSEWRVTEVSGPWIHMVQIKGHHPGQLHHTQSPVQRVV